MKVIVCGAGQVGSNIARYLAGENADVTVIDRSPELIRKISDSLDVQGLVGFASHPDVLQQAGAEDADMLVAVTYSDEVNMVACQICHSVFEVPTKIARVRNQSYLDPAWSDLFSRDNMPIDHIISPEIEVARAISRRLQIPGAFDVIPLADGKVSLIGVHCTEDTPILNAPLRQLTGMFPDLHILIVGIQRDGRGIVPQGDERLYAGDDVYFVAETAHLARAMAAFGHEERQARRVIIVGGGNIGQNLAKRVEERNPHVALKVIEMDKTRAQQVAENLDRAVVIHGSALDTEILEEANVGAAEALVAVSNDDEVNILGSLLAKRYGCERAVTLVNKSSYGGMVGSLGIDTVVSPRAITISSILQYVRRGRIRAVHSVSEGFGELIEAEALETSAVVGVPIRDARLPDGVLIGAIVRGQRVILPRGDTTIRAGDRVIIFAASTAVKKVERLFSVKLEFF